MLIVATRTDVWPLYLFIDRVQEGMRELDTLKDKRDVNLCATMGLILGHKRSRVIGNYVCSENFPLNQRQLRHSCYNKSFNLFNDILTEA